ncbi:MAG: MinD/ParA family protein [Myxococcales bacterium]|nr:MinD/ParA family protein [Myxococcales bacterium]
MISGSKQRSAEDSGGDIIALHPRRERVIALTGGKGGVGKSTIAVNLAVTYAARGAETLAVDADLGMADLNLLLGVAPKKNLLDIINGAKVDEALVSCHGISLLPALNGSFALESMSESRRRAAFDAIESLSSRFETLVIDVAAGLGANQTEFAGAASEVLIVATSEALSLADAYACLKVLALRQGIKTAYIVPNRVRSEAEGEEVFSRLQSLVARFLDLELICLPAIPYDRRVNESGATGVPLVRAYPDSPAARAIRLLARRLDTVAVPDTRGNATRSFWKGILAE